MHLNMVNKLLTDLMTKKGWQQSDDDPKSTGTAACIL